MPITEIITWSALTGFILFGIIALNDGIREKAGATFPLIIAALFLAFTIFISVHEGVAPLLAVLNGNFWGNQIFLDLVFSLGIAWAVLIPRMKAVGMQPLPYIFAMLGTGSIALMVMLARLIQLERRSA